ncbi:MAG: hypothetical protein V1736_06815 [Pseudomonadota bacterium]
MQIQYPRRVFGLVSLITPLLFDIRASDIDFQIKLLGALSVGDVRTGTIPSLLPSQKHYLKVYRVFLHQVKYSDGVIFWT